jgi:hypothetical protein
MAKSKKNSKKPSVKVQDIEPKSDPKGGAFDAYLKIEGVKSGAMSHKSDVAALKTGIKFEQPLTSTELLTNKLK